MQRHEEWKPQRPKEKETERQRLLTRRLVSIIMVLVVALMMTWAHRVTGRW